MTKRNKNPWLECWNIGKIGILAIKEYQNKPAFYKTDSIPLPIIPSFHYSS
jgi:hypothetical protein